MMPGMNSRLQSVFGWLSGLVWEADLRQLQGPQRVAIFVARILHMLFRELLGGQLNLRAMSLVYTTLLSVVPLLAVSFSVLKGFDVHSRFEPAIYDFFSPLGPKGAEITDKIFEFVDNTRAGVLGSLGFALLIYTVIALLQKVEAAFNFVWQVDRLRSFAQRFSNYLSVILVGPVLVFSALGLSASIMNTSLAQQLVAIEPLGTLVVYSGRLVPYVLICLAFTFVYMFIPNTRVRLRAALVGGVIAGVLWETTGWAFAMFVATSSKYAAIYSSFAILILLLIWLYLNWLILLVGSQVAFYVQYPKYMTLHRVRFVISNRLRERLALQLMYLVGYNHYHNLPTWSVDGLVDRLDMPGQPVQRVLNALVKAGYLIEVPGEGTPAYLPAHDIETMRLADLLAAVRQSGESRFLNVRQLPDIDPVDDLLAELEAIPGRVLEGRSLKDLVVDEGAGQPAPS
jgi:membrane protein